MALSYIGQAGASGDGTVTYTNGGAPGAQQVHSGTANGDLLVWLHYGRVAGGNETITWPAGWNQVFNEATANYGHLAMAWRVRTAGDTTYTSTVGNYTSGTTGESIAQTICTWRGQHATTPIGSYTASNSTWASSTNYGSIAAPTDTSLPNGDAVVVFAGRFENATAATVPSSFNLTWASALVANYFNTTLGSDISGVVMNGINNSGSAQTLSGLTVSGSGTAQAGAGRMFVIKAAPALPAIIFQPPPGLPLALLVR